MTNEEIESCLDTIGVYRSVLSFMNVANKDSHEDRDMHIENLDKLEEMLRAEWKSKKAPTALDHIHNVVRDDAYRRGYEQGKKDAASKWIPVTPETMPPDDEEVEVTILDDSGDSPFRYTTVGWHYNGLWIANNERCFGVVSWKPLSEPWKGE